MKVGSVTCLPPPLARQPTLAVITAVALSCILCGTLFLSGIGGLSTLHGALFVSAGGLLAGIVLAGLEKTSQKKYPPTSPVPSLNLGRIKSAQDLSLPLAERVKALLPADIPPIVIPQINQGFSLRIDGRKKVVWCVHLIETPPQAKFLHIPDIPKEIFIPTKERYVLFILDTHDSLLLLEYTEENNLLTYLAQGYENGVLLAKGCLKEETPPTTPSVDTPSFSVRDDQVIYSNGRVQTFASAELAAIMGTELILRGFERTEMLISHDPEQFHLEKQKSLQEGQFWYGFRDDVHCIIAKHKIIFYNQEPTERLATLRLFGCKQVE